MARKSKRTARTELGRTDVAAYHQLRIARQTLKMNDVFAAVMGGPTKAEAREIIKRITGAYPKEG